MRKGVFITFEGGEGTGKTTQIKRVARWLKESGHRVVQTREPGGTPTAEGIRKTLLSKRRIDPIIELFLCLFARKTHVQEVVRPSLAQGAVVLCDRFADATVAYQGFGRRLPISIIARLNRQVTGGLQPDKTFLFDLSPATGLRRIRSRKAPNRFDREGQAFHERVRRGYLTLASKEKKRIKVVDAGRRSDEVFRELCREIGKILTHG